MKVFRLLLLAVATTWSVVAKAGRAEIQAATNVTSTMQPSMGLLTTSVTVAVPDETDEELEWEIVDGEKQGGHARADDNALHSRLPWQDLLPGTVLQPFDR